MSPLHRASLAGYYYGTLPYRKWANKRRASASKSPVMILFYHRVAPDHPNPWTISPSDFERQLDWLAANFDLVSLETAQRLIRSGKNDRPAVAITFDDGYADNCTWAIPLLVKRRVPVTYFVTLRNVQNGMPFPHDFARNVPLRPNTLDEICAMAEAGIEIGAHTRSHADLGRVSDLKKLRDEIVTAGEELQAAIDRPVRYFAFPFGQHVNMTELGIQLAYAAGYDAVCSAYGGYNFPGDDSFHLQRIHADPELLRVKNWLTVDPRKVNVPRFSYSLPLLQDAKERIAAT